MSVLTCETQHFVFLHDPHFGHYRYFHTEYTYAPFLYNFHHNPTPGK